MVVNSEQIVHARGVKYGVCTNDQTFYAGKVCAICRYNPYCALRVGMKGYRTLALQITLNQLGANLDVDGEYGNATSESVKAFQTASGLIATGEADQTTLEVLGLLDDDSDILFQNTVQIIGMTVNIRTGPSTDYPSIKIAKYGETYEAIDTSSWQAILLDGSIRWINKNYLNLNP